MVVVTIAALGFAALAYTHSRSDSVLGRNDTGIHNVVITATIDRQNLSNSLVFRGNVIQGGVVTIAPPSAPEAAQLVVTDVNVAVGDPVTSGALLGSVSERPVFVMSGLVPAFRTMSDGSKGVDVSQLQNDLNAMGLSTSPDPVGLFESGTERAVEALYHRFGYSPIYAPIPSSTSNGRIDMGPTVPFGELIFIPDLPEKVIKVPKVGDVLASSSGSTAFVTLSKSSPGISGQLDTADASTLNNGEKATAISDTTGQKWALKVDSIDAIGGFQGDNVLLSFVSPSSVPQSLVGQNLRIVVGSSKQLVSVLTVPISAIYTSEDGTSFIDLVALKSVRKIKVVIGADDNGTVAIQDAKGLLRAGEEVEVGTYAKLSKAN
jgi:hypothetical protein